MEKEKTCILCGRVFARPHGTGNHLWNARKLCGMQCRAAWLKNNKVGFQPGHAGYKNSGNFHKDSIPWNKGSGIQTNDALKRYYESGGQVWNKGKVLNAQEKQLALNALSLARLSLPRGEKHWNWKGGKTKLRNSLKELYVYREWRSQIFSRDSFVCQGCGQRGGYLHAHHLRSLSLILEENKIKTVAQAKACKELWDVNNGQTLCRSCHHKTDTFGSKCIIIKVKILGYNPPSKIKENGTA